MKRVKKAIFLVAGMGTRFLPATKAQPKEMLPIVDKPVVQFLVEEAVDSGIEEIIFVTGRGKRAIEDHFDYAIELEQSLKKSGKKELLKVIREISSLAKFSYVRQKEPKGTGDAVLCASHLVNNEPVAVIFGDDLIFSKTPCLKQMIKIFEKYQDPVIAVEAVPKKEVFKYGVVEALQIEKRIFEIKSIVEKPSVKKAPSNLIIVGRHIFTPEVFEEIKKIKPSKKEEIMLTDALKNFLKRRPIYGYQFMGDHYDCGTKIGFLKANIAYGLSHKETKNELKKYLKTIK